MYHLKVRSENMGVAVGILFLFGMEMEIPWVIALPLLPLTVVKESIPYCA
jgi:hypothetical protein